MFSRGIYWLRRFATKRVPIEPILGLVTFDNKDLPLPFEEGREIRPVRPVTAVTPRRTAKVPLTEHFIGESHYVRF